MGRIGNLETVMKLSELVNIGELRELCKSFTAITGAVTAILDPEGNILIASGWQDICTRFHRTHAVTASRCRASDIALAVPLGEGESYNIRRCQNGLFDVAFPITVGGEHVATFFTGQFLFERPDREYFSRQAEEFGFDKDSYLAALDRVPVFSEDKVRSMLEFFIHLTQVIGELGLAGKKLEEANAQLHNHQEHLEELVKEGTAELLKANRELQGEIAERKQMEALLRATEQRFRTLAAATFEGVAITENGWLVDVNEQFMKIVGYEREELLHMKLADLVPPEEVDLVTANILQGRENNMEHGIVCKDGSRRIVEAHGKPVEQMDQPGRNLRIAAVRDITERKRTEAEIQQLNSEAAARAAELESANKELEAAKKARGSASALPR